MSRLTDVRIVTLPPIHELAPTWSHQESVYVVTMHRLVSLLGAWPSLVRRLFVEQEIVGSNPIVPANFMDT